MSHIYANLSNNIYSQIDEARYQTIGRGHGFLELNGVPFKLADKYQSSIRETPGSIMQLANLSFAKTHAVEDASAYTFDLERKVLQNMQWRGS